MSLRMRLFLFSSVLLVAALFSGCTRRLASSDLEQVRRPALVSRVQEGAGPSASVFRSDANLANKLEGLTAQEADKRLEGALGRAVGRFEVSDRLRGDVALHLPGRAPWTKTVDPAAVASALDTLLVQEIPSSTPDYSSLTKLGADSVVELMVESYGLHVGQGGVFAFVRGHGRMFFINGHDIWRQDFSKEGAEMGRPPLDPVQLTEKPELFRAELEALLDAAGEDLAKGLAPPPES